MKNLLMIFMFLAITKIYASQDEIIIKVQDKNQTYRNKKLDSMLCLNKNSCLTFHSEGRLQIKETSLRSKVKHLSEDTFSVKEDKLFLNYQNESIHIGNVNKENPLVWKVSLLKNVKISSKIQRRNISVGLDGDEYIIYPTFKRTKIINMNIYINETTVYNVLAKVETDLFNRGHFKGSGYTFLTTKNGILEDDTNTTLPKDCQFDEFSSSYLMGHTKLMQLLQTSYLSSAELLEVEDIIKNGKENLNYQTKDLCGYRPVLSGAHIGQTALMLASEKAYSSIVKLLLENGANPNLKDEYGRTALFYIQGSYGPDKKKDATKTIYYLIDSSIDISSESFYVDEHKLKIISTNPIHRFATDLTLTPLMHFTRFLNYNAQFNQHVYDAIDLLVGNGADINQQAKHGYTALHLTAASQVKLKHVNYLLNYGADKNIKDNKGNRAISWVGVRDAWTTEEEYTKVIELLK